MPLASLIPEPTPQSVAGALQELLGREVPEAQLRKVREDTARRYSVDRQVEDISSLYREELAKVS